MTDKDESELETPGTGPDEGEAGYGGGWPLPEAEWTVMVYMAGDNTLADYNVLALAELRGLKTANLVHVVAQLDPQDARMKTRRLVINKKDKTRGQGRPGAAGDEGAGGLAAAAAGDESGGDSDGDSGGQSELSLDSIKALEDGRLPGGKIKFPREEPASTPTPRRSGAGATNAGTTNTGETNTGETNTADPETLFDFISWTRDNCPARNYMLVLSGHSAGVEDGFLMKDENPPGSMSFDDLMDVLRAVEDPDEGLGMRLDILGLDSCLMNMAEVCYEMRDLATFVVGSQGYIPNPGWPYRRIIGALHEAGALMDPETLSRRIVDEYIKHYLENSALGGLSVDLCALRLGASGVVMEAVRGLVEVLMPRLKNRADSAFKKDIVYAHWASQSYNGELFVDLCDFCEMLTESCNDQTVTDACKAVKESVNEMVVISCFCGIDCQHSNGLSIYFPWSVIFASYEQLKFAQDAGWYDFLSEYVEATRREPRGGPPVEDTAGVEKAFRTTAAPFNLKLGNRRNPPDGHGPAANMNSMRNPPRQWTSKGFSQCTGGEEKLRKMFQAL